MRERIARKIRRALRNDKFPDLRNRVRQHEAAGLSLPQALWAVIQDPSSGYLTRREAAKLYNLIAPHEAARSLVQILNTETDPDRLFEVGLALERLDDAPIAPSLLKALESPFPARRRAAARALGWNYARRATVRIRRALLAHSLDPNEALEVRIEATESLAYTGKSPEMVALLPQLKASEVAIRFWTVFAVASIVKTPWFQRPFTPAESEAIAAIEALLDDRAYYPGWWRINQEAIDMLQGIRDPAQHDALRAAELARATAPEDAHWVKFKLEEIEWEKARRR